jgi:hypothetical protein
MEAIGSPEGLRSTGLVGAEVPVRKPTIDRHHLFDEVRSPQQSIRPVLGRYRMRSAT